MEKTEWSEEDAKVQTHRGTDVRNEPDDTETLYMQPSLHDKGVMVQSMAIAPLRKKETSIIFSKHYWNQRIPDFIHLIFTEEETDMLIEALQEVKERWVTGKVIK